MVTGPEMLIKDSSEGRDRFAERGHIRKRNKVGAPGTAVSLGY